MELNTQALSHAIATTGLNQRNVTATAQLLFGEECTIPFIARYRKEVTGNLDEVQIRDIKESYEEYLELEKRKSYILEAIKKLDQLTPELEKKILATDKLNILEDLYAPYKAKKKTKAMIAKENGLAPLADLILSAKEPISPEKITEFVAKTEGKIKNVKEAMDGACDIIVEQFVHHPETKEELREVYWRQAIFTSSKKKDAEKVKDFEKYRDFFEFSSPLADLKNPKNTHRFMAMRRGMNQKVLKLEVKLEGDFPYQLIEKNHFPKGSHLGEYDLLKELAKKAFDSYISTSLDLEMKTELKKVSDEAAIDVFGINLKNLLLQPYLGSKAVLGIDPGIRTGCKVVVIDKTGKYIGDHVIYPFEPRNDVQGSKLVLEKLVEAFEVEYIAIGNGTNGRETLEFVQDHVQAVKDDKIKATLVNESGASIYSASDIARAEFPDKDVTVRGAISIARRFQDPLAELVKIDPKSIGVGQYQHDVNQAKLKKSLDAVVESCVNYVGVDINTASAPLLSFISGIGPSVAGNIVKHRDKNGLFKSRSELEKVTRFSQKIYEQSAGFLRIYNGKNPLDGTFIHPERYGVLENWAKENNTTLEKLVSDTDTISQLERDKNLESQLGPHTFNDIIQSLKAPKQDPRSEFTPTEFRKDVREMKDLVVNEWYNGVVNNITNFGAFVDIGLKESGLLHVSQISETFVENPLDKLTVGQNLKVRVTEVDLERKRISLSCKKEDAANGRFQSTSKGKPTRTQNSRKPKGKQQEIRNNAFAALANFKVK
ncbi:MAG: RNA-binding transcriptional accessory protein [Halobacteriovoraceae bacterium]|nr:RNA-binding transcriptional accessory protein [Halobacteriovoraceae bacterium]|tara:strand:- start:8119 stop:10431 length:2313 start_codon:yes stop_codon:yes gene_type:complete